MPPRTCDFLRVVVDTVCCLLCLSAAILSTISNNRTVYPDSSPFLSSRVTCLWIFLFFLYGTFTIFDIFNRKQTLPAIIVDVSSLILLLPCLLWIWTELTSNSSTTKYHLYGQHLSLLRISIFSGANFLRFFLSTLCCWDNLSIKQQKHTTKADVVHGNYVKLSSQIDDNEEKKDRDDFNYFIDDNKSVEDQASAWSRFFFCWITPMLHRGYVQQKLDHNDLPHLAHQDVPHRVYSKFLKLWNHSSRPSLFVTLYRLIFWRFYTSGLLLAGSMVAGFAQPMLLHALLVHLENRVSGGSTSTNQESLTWTLQLAAALSIVSLLKSILIHQFWIQGIRCGMHTQLALSSHVLHATMYAEHGVVGSQEFDTGKLLNLLSTDSSRIVDTSVIPAFHWGTWSPFITLIVVIVNLFYLLGIPAISGVITTLLFSGLGVWIGRSIKRAAALTIAKRDLRSTLIEQMLRSIRVIKSFSYESIVKSNITLARNDEMSQQRRQQYLSMLSAAISIVGPLLTTAITFVWYSLAGGKLTASVAFASLAWYDVLRNSLQNIPWAYVATAGTMISIKRLERFFNRARTGKIDNDKIVHLDNTEMNESDLVFKLQNCTIGWSVSKEEILEQKEQKVKTKRETLPILVNVNVCINHGQFICITGPVGSGKSTLLNVLCGHLKPLTTFTAENNTLQINSNRTYAYVGQHAWLRSTTVLENITMYGERNPINKKRLRSVIDSCLLGPDLTELPNGLDTEVGSDGITLSGGQRQRIALARAVYSDRDCVLLDDVLSAVDATVRRHILNKCLVNILKKSGKTIVLVTHDSNVTSHEEVDQVYLIQNKELLLINDGRIIEGILQNNMDDVYNEKMNDRDTLETKKDNLKNCINTTNETTNVGTHFNRNEKNSRSNPYISNQHKGKLSCGTVRKYLNAVGYFSVAFTALLFLTGGLLSIGKQWYLTVWVHDDEIYNVTNTINGSNSNNSNNMTSTCCKNVILYSTISGVTAIVAMSRVVVLTCGSLRAATILHEEALNGILYAPLAVFSSVRTGVFMNRMLGDVAKIDSVLANAIVGLVTMVIQMVQIMGVVTFVAPPVLILLPFLAYPYYIAAQYYRWSNRDLRRLMSSSRSPLLTQFGETLHGLIVVRAYRAEELTSNIYEQALSTNVRAYFSQWNANQWITVVLESIGVLIIGGTAIATAFTTGNNHSTSLLGIVLTPGTAGMVLTFTFNLPGTLMWLVRNFTNMETELVAVERLSECIQLIKEEGSDVEFRDDGTLENKCQKIQIPRLIERCCLNSSSSPLLSGHIQMSNVHMRYYETSPNVLKNITINIPSGSKVAVVGRTGAGKSSLFLALQRLYSFTGKIYIDDIPVHELQYGNSSIITSSRATSLIGIRNMYAYVPQDPILFSGTIRSNLTLGIKKDELPSDAVLWSTLAHLSMDVIVKQWPDQLNTPILSLGENLSAGERQLLCLARALLCRARILLVDEGMSSVDEKTDQVAHDALLNIEGCTVLSICHNLGSLHRFDKVLVMDGGKIVEYGSPVDLLNSTETGEILRELVEGT